MTRLLAAASLIYLIASLWYVTLTRGYGTPFSDSLTEDQREILARSKSRRRQAFLSGIMIGTVFVLWGLPAIV